MTLPIQTPRNHPISLEIIIPIYNEEEVITHLLQRLDQTFSTENQKTHQISRITYSFIDDGSQDQCVQKIQDTQSMVADIKIIRFSRNFGHQSAVTAGLFQAEGEVNAIIDADLQDPPELNLEMLSK